MTLVINQNTTNPRDVDKKIIEAINTIGDAIDGIDYTTPDKIQPSIFLPLTSNLINKGGKPLTFTRASIAFYPDDFGIYRRYAANIPGFNSKGIWIEPQRTNVCTNFNAAPAIDASVTASNSAATIVTDVGLISESGLADIVVSGTLYQYTNVTGSNQTVTISGNAASTALLSASLFGRTYGSGSAYLQLSDGSGVVRIDNKKTLKRVTSESIVHTNTTDTLQILVEPSTTVQWVLNQLELGTATSAGTTSPIVVAGASATRNATLLTMPITSNDIIPANNFTLYGEFTPSTSHQDVGTTNGCALLGIYQVSPLNRLIIRGVFMSKTLAGVDTDTNKLGVFPTKSKTFKVALVQSNTDGYKGFFNGEPAYNYAPLTADLPITSGFLTIGIDNNSNTSRQFIGQIKNVKVFSAALDDTTLKVVTKTNSIEVLEGFGPCIFDATNPNRVWALKKDTNGVYSDVVYSDDFLESYSTWATLEATTSAPTISQDPYGNIYYLSNGTTQLKRIDAVTKATTTCITFFPSGRSWSWTQWHWGIDKAGNIYTCAYSLALGDNHYIWYSQDKGATFTRYDALVTQYPAGGTYRHIHSLHVNPITNKLYVSFGDAVRGTLVSKASTGLLLPNAVFATDWDVVTEATNPGPVGITFTNDLTIVATDNVGSQNYIKHVVGTVATNSFKFEPPLAVIPSYFIRAVGDLELWGAAYNETSVTTSQSTLWKLKRDYIGAQWYLADVYQGYDSNKVGLDFYEICWDLFGTHPEAPYLFATVINKSTGARKLLRILR